MAAGTGQTRFQTYVFLVGHGLLVLGFIFFTVGFATDHWLAAGSDRYGLWEKCVGGLCRQTSSSFRPWMLATRGMQTMALICYMTGVLLALFFHCTTHTLSIPNFFGRERILEILTGIGSGLCFIGVTVYGNDGDESGTLKYSYALTVFSLFLLAPGAAIVAVTRNSVTKASSVRPHPQELGDISVTTTVSSQYPQRPHSESGPAFSASREDSNCGIHQHDQFHRGQHTDSLPLPHTGGLFAYGPVSDSGSLPYPVYPTGPGTPGGQATAHDPQRGGQGGQHRAQSRLPPISEVSPSAPPPPPDHEGPPSYMEAIGHHPCP